jgi:hypothetical protein
MMPIHSTCYPELQQYGLHDSLLHSTKIIVCLEVAFPKKLSAKQEQGTHTIYTVVYSCVHASVTTIHSTIHFLTRDTVEDTCNHIRNSFCAFF